MEPENQNQYKKNDCLTFLCACTNSVLCIIMIISFLNIVGINFEKEEFNITKINYPKNENSSFWSLCDNNDFYQFKYCINLYANVGGIENRVINSYNTKQYCTIVSDCEIKSKNILQIEIDNIVKKYLYKKNNFYMYEDEVYLEYYTRNYTIPLLILLLIFVLMCLYCVCIYLC